MYCSSILYEVDSKGEMVGEGKCRRRRTVLDDIFAYVRHGTQLKFSPPRYCLADGGDCVL